MAILIARFHASMTYLLLGLRERMFNARNIYNNKYKYKRPVASLIYMYRYRVAYEQTSRAKIRDNFHHEQRIIYYSTDSNKDFIHFSLKTHLAKSIDHVL